MSIHKEAIMRINCGFNRRLPGRKGIEHRNVTGIEIDDLDWEDDHNIIRERLMEYRPEGTGWQITGYSLALAKMRPDGVWDGD